MNSLDFIKQHVTEWPVGEYHTVFLYGNGFAVFANSFKPGMGVHAIDLTEHFAPSYYDGKVLTREEFEACGVVEYRYNSSLPQPLLKRDGDKYFYNIEGDWCEYNILPTSHWEQAVKISDSMAANYLKKPFSKRKDGSFDATEIETVNGIDATVEERGNRYGTFKDGADIMQELKSVMRSTPNWSQLTPSQREALEMIQHKVGRILNGDPNYTDSWHDIKGYAHLIEEELNGNVK